MRTLLQGQMLNATVPSKSSKDIEPRIAPMTRMARLCLCSCPMDEERTGHPLIGAIRGSTFDGTLMLNAQKLGLEWEAGRKLNVPSRSWVRQDWTEKPAKLASLV